MKQILQTELILNPDGSIYHLKLQEEHIADTIFIVVDPGRVEKISNHFDNIEYKIRNREFITHTGTYKKKRFSVISTGIGTDNIDIVLNELDAIANIDFQTRMVKEKLRSLNIIRLGTSGALQEDIPTDSLVLSKYGLGLDGLLNFYEPPSHPHITDKEMASIMLVEDMTGSFIEHTNWNTTLAKPYIAEASEHLISVLGNGITQGITVTSPGFYGPQGRILRLATSNPGINDKITSFNFKGNRITNFEMETSALYGLGKLLGHNTCTICTIIANRITKKYSMDYHKTVDKMIKIVLDRANDL